MPTYCARLKFNVGKLLCSMLFIHVLAIYDIHALNYYDLVLYKSLYALITFLADDSNSSEGFQSIQESPFPSITLIKDDKVSSVARDD